MKWNNFLDVHFDRPSQRDVAHHYYCIVLPLKANANLRRFPKFRFPVHTFSGEYDETYRIKSPAHSKDNVRIDV